MKKMIITFVGSGGAFTPEYGNNSALLQFDNTNLLLDCGYSTPARLRKMGIKETMIDNIWISHMHADHIGGLEEVAFKNFFQRQRINLFVGQDIFPDLEQYLSATLKYGVKKQLTIADYFNVITINNEFRIGRRTFKQEKTEHIGAMPAYMLSYNTFIFTGDTKFIDWTVRDLTGIRFIFHETSVEKNGDDVHSNLENLLSLPKEIREKIYCMHYSENIFLETTAARIINQGMHIVEPYKAIVLE